MILLVRVVTGKHDTTHIYLSLVVKMLKFLCFEVLKVSFTKKFIYFIIYQKRGKINFFYFKHFHSKSFIFCKNVL